MEPMSLKEIQEADFKILCKFKEICSQLELEYYLYAGTLIGAIREGGFIPWDDDVDVCMPRDSFEKFCEYCRKNEEKLYPFKLLNGEEESGVEYYISRFCDYSYRLEFSDNTKYDTGLFLDIYPLDYAGNSEKEAKFNLFHSKLIVSFLNRSTDCYKPINPSAAVKIYGAVVSPLAKAIGAKFFIKRLRKLRNKLKNKKGYVTCLVDFVYLFKTIFPASDFDGGVTVSLYGEEFIAPKNYDAVLRRVYGDYMQPPPIEERNPDRHRYSAYKREL